jgi:hypothetical protein
MAFAGAYFETSDYGAFRASQDVLGNELSAPSAHHGKALVCPASPRFAITPNPSAAEIAWTKEGYIKPTAERFALRQVDWRRWLMRWVDFISDRL